MKKTIVIFLFTIAMIQISCKKTEIIRETQTIVQNDNLTIIKTIETNEWQFSNTQNSYSVDVIDTRIDRRVFENDQLSVSVMQGINNFYEPIPFVYDNLSFSYIVGVGQIELNVQGLTPQATVAPLRTKVKIVIIRSSQESKLSKN